MARTAWCMPIRYGPFSKFSGENIIYIHPAKVAQVLTCTVVEYHIPHGMGIKVEISAEDCRRILPEYLNSHEIRLAALLLGLLTCWRSTVALAVAGTTVLQTAMVSSKCADQQVLVNSRQVRKKCLRSSGP